MVGFPIAIDLRNVAHSSPSCSSNTKTTAVHTVMDLDKKDMQTGTRWNPAPEQIQALEKMYRCGLRTPTAQQIQQIASQLRRFAKIEGKNVFYWFQNHKARERQKRRREFKSASEQPKPLQQHCCLETAICLKDPSPAMKRTCAEHNSNWGHSTSHSLTLSREPVMYLHMQREELAASAAAVDMRHTSKQLGDGETTVGRRHAYWEVVQSSPGNLQLLFHPMESNLVRFNGMRVKEEGSGKVETLQLFPTINEDCCSEARDDQPFIDAANNKSSPVQFFQFL